MPLFLANLKVLLTLFVFGIGFSIYFFNGNKRLFYILLCSPLIGLGLISLSGILLVRMDIPVSTWYLPCTIFLIVINALLGWLGFRKNKQILSAGIPKELVTTFIILLAIVIILFIPVMIGGEQYSRFRGNLFDSTNYLSEASYLNSYPISRVSQITETDAAAMGPVVSLFKQSLSRGWIGICTLLAWASNIGGLPVYQMDYGFTVLFFVLMVFPILLISLELNHKWYQSLLLCLVVCGGFWAQLVLDLRAFGQIINNPMLLFFGWLLYRSLEQLKSGNKITFETVLLGLFGGTIILMYPEITPTLGVGSLIYLFIQLYHRNIKIRALLPMLIPLLVAAAVVLLDGGHWFTFIRDQLSSTVNDPSSMAWHGDWFYFLFFTPSAVGLWGMSYLFSQPFDLPVIVKSSLSIEATILTILFFGVVLKMGVNKKTHPINSLFLAFTLTTIFQFVFVFSKMNYWAAFKGLSYGYPYMSLLLLVACYDLLPKMGTKFSGKVLVQWIGVIVCSAWMVSQVGFQIYNMTQVTSGRTYFDPEEPFKRSNRMVDYDPAIAELGDCFSTIKGKSVWVATPSVWTWEYLNMVYGSSVDWYPLFADNHYDQNGLISFGKTTIPQPDYLLVDREIALVKTYPDEFSVICQTDKTMLIQPRPELWNRAFYIGHRAPYNKLDYRYDTVPVGVDASDVLIYSPGKQDISVKLFAKMSGKYSENDPCKIEVQNLDGTDILSLPCSMDNEAVSLPLDFGVNQYRVAVSNIDDRSPEIINFRIVEINYSLASVQ